MEVVLEAFQLGATNSVQDSHEMVVQVEFLP